MSRHTRTVGLAFAVTAVVLAGGGAVAGQATAAGPKAITTPGYVGTRKAPRTKPVTPRSKPTRVKLGVGFEPDVLVDAAGTAHLAWSDSAPPFALHYCRLKRGAGACEVRKDFPQASKVNFFPILVTYGDQLVILQQQGENGGGGVNAYVSDDGGTSFLDGQTLVGGPVKDAGGNLQPGAGEARLQSAVTFGPAGAERIALAFSGGFVQIVRPGAAPGPLTDLLPAGAQRVHGSGSVVTTGAGLTVAFGGVGGNSTFLRTWNRSGEPSDVAQWSAPARLPEATGGDLPQLTGGPAGTFLQTTHPSGRGGGTVQLRKLDASGTPGAPTVLFKELIGDAHPPVQDAAGNVTTSWTLGQTTAGRLGDVVTRRLTSGTRAGPLTTLLTATGGQSFLRPRIGTLPDGGGFVAVRRFPGSEVLVRSVGTQLPTGKLGLGDLPGNVRPGATPGVVETCSRIEFGAVDVAGQGGCLLSAVGRPGIKVSEGTIRLNGLEIVPEKNVKILLNARERTIDTTGAVTVQLRVDDVTIPLFRGELHLNLPGGEPDTTTAAPGCTGTKLLGFNSALSAPVLKGFPIKGEIAVFLKEDSVCIPVALELPKELGGIRGNAVLQADNTNGLKLDSLEIVAPTIPVGPVLIRDLVVSYMGSTDSWTGSATLTFPPGFTLGAKVTFERGAFKGATVTVSPLPWPGTPLFSGVYLNTVTGGFAVDPLSLTIGARVGALPTNPPDGYAVAVTGAIKATFKDPFTLELGATGELFGFPVARLDVLIDSDLYFQAKADVTFNLSVASFSGALTAFVDGPRGQFGGELAARLSVFGYDIAKADAVISSIGLGGCGKIDLVAGEVEIGAGYKWGDSIPFGVKTMWGSCELGPYRLQAPGPRGRGTRAAGDRTFVVAPGSRLASVRVSGVDGAPDVILVSPSGERITAVEPDAPGGIKGAKAIAGVSPQERATYLAVPKPAPGTWTLEAQPGSPEVAEVGQATPLPAVKVIARVGGSGRARTLVYTVGDAQGRKVTFFEATPRGERLIGVAKDGRGTLRFASAPGPGGPRVIRALVEQDGIPRDRLQVARYVAPAAARPAAIRALKARRAKGGVLVTWRGGRGATSYLVRAVVGDGRRNLFVASRRRLLLPAIARGTRVRVTVRGRNNAGRSGRPRTVLLGRR